MPTQRLIGLSAALALGVCAAAAAPRLAPAPPRGPSGTILIQSGDFAEQTARYATLTPDGAKEEEFSKPKGWPDDVWFPPSVVRSPGGSRAALTGNRKVRPVHQTFLAPFPEAGALDPLDGQLRPMFWSRDGKTLVVEELPAEAIAEADPGAIGKYVAIDLRTKRRAALPVPEGHWLYDRSADGLLLTAGKDPGGKLKGRRLFLLDGRGKVVRALTEEGLVPGPAEFGPDAEWVVLRAAPRSVKGVGGVPAWKLYRTPVERPKPELLAEVPDSEAVGGFALSPDGKWVAFDRSPRVPSDPKAAKPRDPGAAGEEVEFAVVVVGLDGKAPRTIKSVKTKKPFSISLGVIDWR
jgi:hypothetical protein